MQRPMLIDSTEALRHAVELGKTPESIVLEFKEELEGFGAKDPKPLREKRLECARDVAQFANTLGGTLLFGVAEQEQPNGQRIALRWQSLRELDRKREWIEEALQRHLFPNTVILHIFAIRIDEADVLAVNVPASRTLITVWDAEGKSAQYLRRLNGKKEYMNPDAALHHALDRSRAIAIALHRVWDELGASKAPHQVDLIGRFVARFQGMTQPLSLPVYLVAIGEYECELTAGGHTVRIPYGLIREAWRTVAGRVGLAIEASIVIERQNGGEYARLDL